MSNQIRSDQIRSVAQSCPTLFDPMNRSTPGLPVQHQLPEFTETHVHQVSDAIQLSHPLLSPSPLAPNHSQHQKWPKYCIFSISIIPSKEIPANLLSQYYCLMNSSVQSLSHVQLLVTSWIAACQASLSITNSRSSLRLMSIKSVMPSSHLILCHPLLLLPPIPPSIRVFSNESTLCMSWPDYWSFSFSTIPSKEIPRLSSFRIDWLTQNSTARYYQI